MAWKATTLLYVSSTGMQATKPNRPLKQRVLAFRGNGIEAENFLPIQVDPAEKRNSFLRRDYLDNAEATLALHFAKSMLVIFPKENWWQRQLVRIWQPRLRCNFHWSQIWPFSSTHFRNLKSPRQSGENCGS